VSTEDVHLPGEAPGEAHEAANLAEMREGIARRLLLLGLLKSAADSEIKESRRQLRLAGLRPGNTIRPPMLDGKPAGAVTYSIGSVAAEVVDPEAFAGWVLKRYPTATRLRVEVAEWFTAQVIAGSEAAGVPIGPGGETGEDAPPGVRVGERAGSIGARPDRKRSAVLWAEIRTLTHELEAGNDDSE
jgi:hypothetical protein